MYQFIFCLTANEVAKAKVEVKALLEKNIGKLLTINTKNHIIWASCDVCSILAFPFPTSAMILVVCNIISITVRVRGRNLFACYIFLNKSNISINIMSLDEVLEQPTQQN